MRPDNKHKKIIISRAWSYMIHENGEESMISSKGGPMEQFFKII